MTHVVIVGAGHAGVQVADSLRAGGFDGAVTLVGDDPALPYQRPPLSKDYFTPGTEPGPLPLRAERFFADRSIDLRRGATATAVDRRRTTVLLDDGEELTYTALVLATGAANRSLAVPGGELPGLHELRTLTDAERLRSALTEARSVIVVGAGFIGLEFAAVARRYDVEVTVLEAAPRPMGRALSPRMADHVTDAHARMGTDLRLGEGLAAFVGAGGRAAGAVGASGREYRADLVVVGVGVRPRDELARQAGLEVADGIVVDENLRTSDPAVYAIGDCASFPAGSPNVLTRLESVQNATDHGRHAARMILGRDDGYSEVPWFWSNQAALRLQIAGLTQPGDTTVVSGDVASGRFSVFCYRGERLAAVESLNRPADHMAARRVLAAGASPMPAQVVDPTFSLKDHAKQLSSDR